MIIDETDKLYSNIIKDKENVINEYNLLMECDFFYNY
jgi:hypothetical protein